MQEIIIGWFSGFPKELATFLIAVIPITELPFKPYFLPAATVLPCPKAFSRWPPV